MRKLWLRAYRVCLGVSVCGLCWCPDSYAANASVRCRRIRDESGRTHGGSKVSVPGLQRVRSVRAAIPQAVRLSSICVCMSVCIDLYSLTSKWSCPVCLMAILFGCPSGMVLLLCLLLKRVGNYSTGTCAAVHQVVCRGAGRVSVIIMRMGKSSKRHRLSSLVAIGLRTLRTTEPTRHRHPWPHVTRGVAHVRP